ncbi:Type 1 glutamine amidotransferase-like domain-containing protein [Lacinutrix mariniflava]|uniref:Type 1 glutamine amidotransferase-like domain-containing protein n=1 Tax=Lacinutrix mariniflava TaxID=342955 RepID=UPI0006E3425B|nr:Type 1 glutamine amidotransferase-like domain-containing protein [Lacinutrix mariniflava]
MKKLFLSSSFVDVAEFLEPFVGKKLKHKTITFIPIASVPEEYKGYVDDDKKALEKLGLIVQDLDIANTSQEKVKETIEKNDFIYVSGGNTFYLLQELIKSGADKVITSEIENGKVYVGASAGSVILSKSITYVEEMDDKTKAENLKDYNALNSIDFYPLPHYTNEPFKAAADSVFKAYDSKIKLVPISNTEVILVEDNKMSIAGKR